MNHIDIAEVKTPYGFGYVLHNNENFDEEKQNGILNLEIYSDEDWKKYGDNIALAKVDSQEWTNWVFNRVEYENMVVKFKNMA